MNERDKILKEHASDVANTVSCNMTNSEATALKSRFLLRIEKLKKFDPKLAALFLSALDHN